VNKLSSESQITFREVTDFFMAVSIYIFKTQHNIMKFRVLIEQDEDGVFVATVPELPGCISQGKTRDEAISNIKDAVEGYLVSLKKHNEPIPPSIMEEMIEVNA
jgi:antitoxin HicB